MNKIYIIIFILTLALVGYFCYDKFAYLNIVIKFDDLEPFERQMNVYYKGFKIGKTTKIYPDKNYINTYIKLKLHPHDIKLPENITARIQSSKNSRYINILYPDSPSLKIIKENDIIKGKVAKDINSLINDDGFNEIISDTSNLITSANETAQSIGALFNQLNEILSEIRGDIILACSNLAKTTTHIKNMSENLDSSLDKKTMQSSVNNIEKTTENIKEITDDINGITTQIDKVSMPTVNSILCDTNQITCGIKNTLKKHFGIGRLLFGRPINNKCN